MDSFSKGEDVSKEAMAVAYSAKFQEKANGSRMAQDSLSTFLKSAWVFVHYSSPIPPGTTDSGIAANTEPLLTPADASDDRPLILVRRDPSRCPNSPPTTNS